MIKTHTAARMSQFERFYIPHQLDFCGRLYPIPILFHQQGDDICRGLIEFAEPKDCTGANAKFWLKIHVANCCGVDKVTFSKRVVWTNANMDTFAGWVENPLVNTGWMEQDEPFQALAAARGLLYPEHGAYLPVGIDGSNNALQHYAAMIRCEDAARMVNVYPNEAPQDFYAVVADHVSTLIGKDADAGKQMARSLDNWVNRKLVKQTAMTNYYGVTAIGARRQMHESLDGAGFDETHLYHASKYLSKMVLEASATACPTVQGALDWLRECARMICKSGQPITWTSPIGMRVEQTYRNSRSMQIQTPFGKLCPRSMDDSCPINSQKQVNAFAPNFVHSVDASHLMCCAIICRDKKIDFGGVHDKVLAHAANMDKVANITREHFCLIHEEPLLEKLADELTSQFKLDFPPTPPLGKFDISLTKESKYLFA